MRYLDNKVKSKDLVVLLHGVSSGINSMLFKILFDKLKNSKKRIIALEFSFIADKTEPSSDQVVETNELKHFLARQKFNNLTIIGHSNGAFVGLVALSQGVKINNLILLGLSGVNKDGTKEAIAKIIKNGVNQGTIISIVQSEDDPYASPLEEKSFISNFDLDIDLINTPGDHYFANHEVELADRILSTFKFTN